MLQETKPSQDMLKNVLENIGAAYLLESIDRKIIMTNENFCTLFHLNAAPSDLQGQDCSSAAQQVKHLFLNAENFVSNTEHLIKNGKSNTGEILRMIDGTTLLRNFSPIDLGNDTNGYLWSYLNISEHIFHEELEIQLALNYFVSSLYKENSVEEILQNIAKNSISQLGFLDCVIYVMDEERQILIQKAAWGPKATDKNAIINPLEIPVGKGIVGYVAKTGIAEIINDTSKDERYILDDESRLSEITVPIVLDGKVIGIIDSEHPAAGFYTQKHLVILSTIASLSAVKIKQLNSTLEKQTEIIQQKDFYEKILNGIPADIAVFAPDHRYLFVNPQGIKDDWLRQWIINKRDEDYCELRNKPHWIFETRRRYFNQALQTKKLVSWEEKLIRSDGSDNWIIRTFHPLIGNDGNISIVIGYGINITDRKKAELFAQENEKKLRDLFDYSPVMIFTHDMRYNILTANAATRHVLGVNPTDIIGKNLAQLALDGEDDTAFRNYQQMLASGTDLTGVVPVRHASGELIYLLCNGHKVTSHNEAPYVIAFCQDISKMIIAEKKLKEANKITEEMALEKERFWATTSHELRTPLNGIIGIADLLNKTSNENKQQKYISILQHSAQNLLSIINNVLDIEKIQSGNITVNRQLFSLKQQIELLNETFEPLALKKGIDFTINYTIEPDLLLEGDYHKMHQILSNLVSNAIKFTQKGNVTITATISNQSFHHSDIGISFGIQDSGYGIPEEMIEKIFDPFIQLHGHSDARESGSGLGLTICRQLTNLLNGTLSVKSNIGKGSTFTLILPFRQANGTLQAHKHTFSKNKFSERKKILLAEDSHLNQFIIKEMIDGYNIELDIAENGKEAVQLACTTNYNLILMDIQMPVMDGKEALKQIRNTPGEFNHQTPVISLSANAFEKDLEEYRKLGFTDSLTKPFTEAMLIEIIKKHIYNKPIVISNPEPQSGKASLLDLDYLTKTGKGKKEFVQKILVNFLEQIPTDCSELSQTITAANLPELAKTAHRLKFSFKVIGATDLYNEALSIEQAAKENNTANIASIKENVFCLIDLMNTLSDEIKLRISSENYI